MGTRVDGVYKMSEAILGAIAFLIGICGFNYWAFGQMGKRLDAKLDSVSLDVHRIANQLRGERRIKESLYKFALDNYNKSGYKKSVGFYESGGSWEL